MLHPPAASRPRRLLILEINEISWELMSPWLESGDLPHFRRLQEQGTWGRTFTDEPGGPEGLLEPWVTWTTFYTGVPHTEHGMQFLEQPPETVRAKRAWDFAAEGGKKVGLFGSIGTWPPRQLESFVVPGSFSPDAQTYPERLRPIQDLNLRYTRAHAPGAKAPGRLDMVGRGLRLLRLGLNAGTVLTVFRTLLEIKRHPERDWKKVCLQPLVNLAFFKKLYRDGRPDFATFHTNHVAHYQHRFMRAWQPEAFPDATDAAEVERFRGAIRYGYLVADRLLGHFFRLCEREGDVVLCVASSMGQKPYVPAKYAEKAPLTCRVRSIERLVELLGLAGRCEFFSTMAPQWNLRIADERLRERAIQDLLSARYEPAGKTMYSTTVVKDCVVLTPISHHGVGPGTVCRFPTLDGSPSFPFEQLVLQADDTRKSGCHDPVGMLAFYGAGVPRNTSFGQVNNLDVAPTLLTLLGLPVPPIMKGRVIDALFPEARQPAAAAAC
jgi:hypothetical protein